METSNIRVRWWKYEGPTWLVAIALYGSWLALTYFHARIPAWLLLPAGGLLVAWHSSLQHETIHGHPAGVRWAATVLGFPPLSLWLPYALYRESHRRHHQRTTLTDPHLDPESFYVSQATWTRWGPVRRGLAWFHATLLGRLLLGPLVTVGRFFAVEGSRIVHGYRRRRSLWAWHLVAVAVVLAWVVGVCHLSVGRYLLFFVYPGTALSLFRAFTEHRASESGPQTAIVEGNAVFGLLFLNNNLHAAHHEQPEIAWYRLPAYCQAHRHELAAAYGNLLFPRGYLDIIVRYLLRAPRSPVHPTR